MEIRIYCEQYLNGEIPVLPGKQVEKKTEPLPEVQPQEPKLSDVPVVVQEDSKDESLEIQEVETPDPEIDNIADNASPMLPKVLKWGLPLVFLLGIVFFIFRSMEQRQEKEEAKAESNGN